MSKDKPVATTFTKNDVEIIARETLYSGFFSLDLYRFRHRLFNGEMSNEVRREIFERGHAAVLLPYDPVRDEIVLIEQIRIAAYDTSDTPWLLELVAGMIEEGAPASGYRCWLVKWMPHRPKVYMVWWTKTKIFVFMW
ncbi:MAG: ADP-ribose diphosphatase [Enterobacter kobei]|nr:ADP-ribose diphosphatase [Enterobacter kobei]